MRYLPHAALVTLGGLCLAAVLTSTTLAPHAPDAAVRPVQAAPAVTAAP